jgi:hypothetical protein
MSALNLSQTKLRTLDVGNNEIEVIEGIAHLSELEEFWVRTNEAHPLRVFYTRRIHLLYMRLSSHSPATEGEHSLLPLSLDPGVAASAD